VGGPDKVNILLVDDQPGKLLSYEAILGELDENLIKANSAREALECLLKAEIAVILLDVSMPELDGFQLAQMIREHPRYQKTAIIFISAIQVEDVDQLRGYDIGAVDYVPVPVVPAVLRAKVRIFVDLYRKTHELERLNRELESRVAQRTAELEASTERLRQSEERRSLALAAGQMGSWDINLLTGEHNWDDGQYQIFGVDRSFRPAPTTFRELVHPDDREHQTAVWNRMVQEGHSMQSEFRIVRPSGEVRWCLISAAATLSVEGMPIRISGVTLDITERKEAEQRQALLAREVDHRARNTLAVVQSILRLTRADSVSDLVTALDGRVQALARAHTLLSNTRWQGADLTRLVAEEMDPYRDAEAARVETNGPTVLLRPSMAQAFALVLHELATNAAKYGALSALGGRVKVNWQLQPERLVIDWTETGGPATTTPTKNGFGTRVVIATIERELGGEATFEWRPAGLHCLLSVPRTDVLGQRPGAPRAAAQSRLAQVDSPARSSVDARRVLLVEDEALVAIMMRDMLTELGFHVVGPMSNTTLALAAARQADFDCAILDLNLGGEISYPVADELSARGVPYIFVTGYDKEGLDKRYEAVPLLQKPVDEASLRAVMQAFFSPPARDEAPKTAAAV
jgi:two-component sensor histidine kinase/DNA-binding response OmpR family regulator